MDSTATSNYVLACNKTQSLQQKQLTRVEVPSFNCTVNELSQSIGQLLNLDKDSFDITCFGKTLESSKSLESYGINRGIIVYLTKRKESLFKEPQVPATPDISPEGLLSSNVEKMCVALKSALINPLFRKVIESLSDAEKRENLMAINTALRNDPTLFGILTDEHLLNTYITKPGNIKSVLKRYPNFLEVATYVAATFHEESSSSNAFHLEALDRSAFLNYSIDAPSDDEMDETDTSSVSSNNTQASAASGSSSNRLTEHPTQSFSNMLMRAYQNRQTSHPAAASQSPSPASSSGSPIITPDMLRMALQSSVTPAPAPPVTAVAPAPSSVAAAPAAAAAVPPANTQRSTAQILIGWAPQLRQMRELGITDDIVAIQALEATNGDVQAAINIIFSDFN